MIRKSLCLFFFASIVSIPSAEPVERPWSVTTNPVALVFGYPNLGVEYLARPDLGFMVWGAFSTTGKHPTQEALGAGPLVSAALRRACLATRPGGLLLARPPVLPRR